ncbi:Chromosome transmission fidelity protein 18 [Wickerhamomyces ciferrii]|uniref:Chromosome transmission fidelity protein 18 n=1 Tax=Wickerhamomyces ciferrii (strain ATCC 14091 / BCRC 22168 / CBS 111 / JCM 3599 / NBRC 0793 / NRRL Y-1031 F-60-10) TaxID=1206466 RepID=K0KE79_WICCF|nr:Chromosome transmission fidelity protein 18 [Wickerhamomyces ciferrii]CCH41221.1 Chromosome transmission fidelity protein 18 [Wickerhamomyces ciferrii]
MSKPVLDFGLGSLDFKNKFLAGGNGNNDGKDEIYKDKSESPNDTQKDTDLSGKESVANDTTRNITPSTQVSLGSSIIEKNTNAKVITLPNGKIVNLKKKPSRQEDPESAIDALKQEKENYGFNINELYGRLEVKRLKEAPSSRNQDSYIPQNNILWAEKWRPKSFFDLLGNEATNRRILKWIKDWSRVVFDQNLKPITTEDSNPQSKFTDPFGRPSKKILLIHGPPGLGKTTVAHVIAKQAGYEIMEVNASDERSGQRVRDKINNSLNSQTFSGKPVCLIADEVDGAAEFGFVKVLLDLINEDSRAVYKYQNSESSKFKEDNGKKKKQPKFLLRPIIAICNDLYAPSLEKLRAQSEIINFKAPTERELRDRLRDICKHEKINITNQQLQEIVLLANYDIRSCLNILQFGGGLNNSNDLRKKDSQVSWFSIVNEIFRRRRDKKKNEQFKELSEIININPSYDKIINGCFQSYHDVTYNDSQMSKPALISDWLFFGDIMGKTTYEGYGDLSYYSSQVALQFYNLFGDLGNRENLKIKSDYEHFESRRSNFNLLRQIHGNLNAQLRTLLKPHYLSTDALPLLDHIITPELKSINNIKENDQLKLRQAANALSGFGLQITDAKDDSYNDIFTTYPQFHTISKFDPLTVKKQNQKRTQLFPLMLKELDVMKAKKRAFSKVDQGEGPSDGVSQTSKDFNALRNQYEQIAEAEAKNKKPKTEVKIWVKYHEGFSNAVRKPVKWNALWG